MSECRPVLWSCVCVCVLLHRRFVSEVRWRGEREEPRDIVCESPIESLCGEHRWRAFLLALSRLPASRPARRRRSAAHSLWSM